MIVALEVLSGSLYADTGSVYLLLSALVLYLLSTQVQTFCLYSLRGGTVNGSDRWKQMLSPNKWQDQSGLPSIAKSKQTHIRTQMV